VHGNEERDYRRDKNRINYVLYLMHIETPAGWGDFYTYSFADVAVLDFVYGVNHRHCTYWIGAVALNSDGLELRCDSEAA
jgi:hypothetical protein